MPVVGSNEVAGSTRTFGDIPNIPESRQAAVRYGVHFFELRYPKPIEMDQTVYGPFDVSVGESWNTMRNRMDFNVKWETESAAHVRFAPDEKSVGIAWLPDDKFWRNRVFLMDTPLLYNSIAAYHTSSGQYPGTVMRVEIDAMREVLKKSHKIWHIIFNGRPISYHRNLEDAEEYVAENTETHQKIDPSTGTIKQIKNNNKFKIIEGTKIDYKEEIVSLIKRENRNHTFGWTESETFVKEIKPKIVELIEKKRKIAESSGGESKKAEIFKAIGGLSKKEKAELAMLIAGKVPQSTHDNDAVVIPEGSTDLKFDPWTKQKKWQYNRLNRSDIVKIYEARGGDSSGISLMKLVDHLVEQDSKDSKPEMEESAV